MSIVDTVRKHVVDKYSQAYDSDDINMYKVHVRYVVDYAKELARKLGADIEIVEIAALLHDIARIDGTNENHHIEGAEYAEKFLKEYNYDTEKIEQVKHCIITHRGSVSIPRESIEAECVASADAMAHFKNIPGMFYFIFVYLEKGIEEGKEMLRKKLDRSYKKMIPEAQEIIQDRYEAALEILK
jgi:uncharacterized protein